MNDFPKALTFLREELKNMPGTDLALAYIEEMEQGYDSLDNERDDLIACLRSADCVQCNSEKHKGEWITTMQGNAEYDEDPEKRYCENCASEMVDGKCTWKPEEAEQDE